MSEWKWEQLWLSILLPTAIWISILYKEVSSPAVHSIYITQHWWFLLFCGTCICDLPLSITNEIDYAFSWYHRKYKCKRHISWEKFLLRVQLSLLRIVCFCGLFSVKYKCIVLFMHCVRNELTNHIYTYLHTAIYIYVRICYSIRR